jgi:hypothetical protein
MADQLKEIHNADVYLNTFTGASKSIITTNGTTQYVIKDVQIGTNTIPGTEVLSVNGVTTTPTLTANLSGSEIVDVNSTVSVVLPAAPTYSKSGLSGMTNGYSSGSTFVDATNYNVSVGATTSTTAIGPSYPALITGFNQSVANVQEHWVINGDVYYWTYDSNTQFAFYKRTGGFNGTETLLKDYNGNGSISNSVGSYGQVVYGASTNKFYLIGNQNNMVTYDPVTNTATSTTLNQVGWPNLSTYPRMTMSNNGLIFVVPSNGYGSNVWAINPANGHMINFQSMYEITNYTSWGQNSRIFVHFTGTQYLIWRFTNNYMYLTSTSTSSPPTFPTSSSSYYSSYTFNSIWDAGNFVIPNQTSIWRQPDIYTANNATWNCVGTLSATAPVITSINLVTGVLSNVTVTGTINSGFGFKGYSPSLTPTAGEIASITNYPQRIRLRITGVQTTL